MPWVQFATNSNLRFILRFTSTEQTILLPKRFNLFDDAVFFLLDLSQLAYFDNSIEIEIHHKERESEQ